jgi:hypothetical protein
MSGKNPPLEISLESILAFSGPPEIFAFLILAERCGKSGAESGAVFSFNRESKTASALGVFPPMADLEKPLWLDLASQAVVNTDFTPQPRLLPGGPGTAGVVLVPLRREEPGGPEEYACFVPGAFKPETLNFMLRELGESASLWRNYLSRREAGGREDEVVRPVLSILAEINAADKFRQATMAFCNELAAKFNCDRAAVGFLQGRYVHLAAVNHAEKIGRKMDLPRLLELVMEECLDQDEEVFFRPRPNPRPSTGPRPNWCGVLAPALFWLCPCAEARNWWGRWFWRDPDRKRRPTGTWPCCVWPPIWPRPD